MIGQQKLAKKTKLFTVIGIAGIVASAVIMVNILFSIPVVGKTLQNTILAVSRQPPVVVNGRTVYAVPIVTGAEATTILQIIAPNDIAYVVHTFAGLGKSVSTAISWFRRADIVSTTQYNGSQVEVEAWVLLTAQERLEAQAACSL